MRLLRIYLSPARGVALLQPALELLQARHPQVGQGNTPLARGIYPSIVLPARRTCRACPVAETWFAPRYGRGAASPTEARTAFHIGARTTDDSLRDPARVSAVSGHAWPIHAARLSDPAAW